MERQKTAHGDSIDFHMLFFLLLASPPRFSLSTISFRASIAEGKKKCGYWYILMDIVHIGDLSKVFYFCAQHKNARRAEQGRFFLWS